MDYSWFGQFHKQTQTVQKLLQRKIRKQKNIMKNNLNHIVIIYLQCSERQKILNISNILKTTKKS